MLTLHGIALLCIALLFFALLRFDVHGYITPQLIFDDKTFEAMRQQAEAGLGDIVAYKLLLRRCRGNLALQKTQCICVYSHQLSQTCKYLVYVMCGIQQSMLCAGLSLCYVRDLVCPICGT